MIDDDEFYDDIFSMMDRIFGRNPFHRETSNMSDNKYERLMDEDNIYYTFELRDLKKEDIDIKPYTHELLITLKQRTHNIKLPYPIIPDKTKVTFINGILDISVKIDKDKAHRVKIEGD